MKKKVLLLAGEESGVIYARQIAARLADGAEIRGYADYGFKTEDLAVMGIWPVLARLFFFLGVRRTMRRAIASWRPDLVITVDYPGMNMSLAAYAKKLGLKTMHVVSPQVWAWKKRKIPVVERTFDRLCCFLPFEPKCYRDGFAVFTGHPLYDAFCGVKEQAREDGLVAVLPGSRMFEIENLMPVLCAAMDILGNGARVSGLGSRVAGRGSRETASMDKATLDPRPEPRNPRFVIPAANARVRAAIERHLSSCACAKGLVKVVDGGAREILSKATCAVVASGTATLEAALAKCPTVLVYRVSAFTAFFLRLMIKGTRHAGLANILWARCGGSGEQPMPELLQENCTPEKVAVHLSRWLDDPEERARCVGRLEAATSFLRTGEDAMARIAEEASSLLSAAASNETEA